MTEYTGPEYSDYYTVPGITPLMAMCRLQYCMECGATVILDEYSAQSRDIHTRWHVEQRKNQS